MQLIDVNFVHVIKQVWPYHPHTPSTNHKHGLEFVDKHTDQGTGIHSGSRCLVFAPSLYLQLLGYFSYQKHKYAYFTFGQIWIMFGLRVGKINKNSCQQDIWSTFTSLKVIHNRGLFELSKVYDQGAAIFWKIGAPWCKIHISNLYYGI